MRPNDRWDQPAHPIVSNGDPNVMVKSLGMSIRQEFIKAAMQGLLANSNPLNTSDPSDISRWAINHAEETLKAMERL